MSRDALVEAALHTLSEAGYTGLSLRGLARSLGVSLGTVQRHFPTKEDLWRAAIDAALPPPPSDVELGGPGQPAAELGDAIRSLIGRTAVQPGVTATVWNDPSPGAEQRLDYLTDRARDVLAGGRARLHRAVDSGVARPIAPDVFLALLGLGITSLASSPDALRRLFGIDIGDAVQRTALADGLADILLHGLLSPGPQKGPAPAVPRPERKGKS